MTTAYRQSLFTAFSNRMQALGHNLTPAELWFLVDDAETVTQGDASANADATTDVGGGDVQPPDVSGE